MKNEIDEKLLKQEGIKYINQLGEYCLAYDGYLLIKGNQFKRIICSTNIMPYYSNLILDITSILCNMLMSQTTLQFIELETDNCETFYTERYSSDTDTTNIIQLLRIKKSISCHLVKDISNQDDNAVQQGIELTKISSSIRKIICNLDYTKEIDFESIQQMVDQLCQEYPECILQ